MADPIIIDVPHNKEREQIREKLNRKIGDLPGHIPGGLAKVEYEWAGEDEMLLRVDAMGQRINADLLIMDNAVRLTVDLPPSLGLMRGFIEGAIRKQAAGLIGEKKA